MKTKETNNYTKIIRVFLIIGRILAVLTAIISSVVIIKVYRYTSFGYIEGFEFYVVLANVVALAVVLLLLYLAELRIVLIENLTESQKAIERIENQLYSNAIRIKQ